MPGDELVSLRDLPRLRRPIIGEIYGCDRVLVGDSGDIDEADGAPSYAEAVASLPDSTTKVRPFVFSPGGRHDDDLVGHVTSLSSGSTSSLSSSGTLAADVAAGGATCR